MLVALIGKSHLTNMITKTNGHTLKLILTWPQLACLNKNSNVGFEGVTTELYD